MVTDQDHFQDHQIYMTEAILTDMNILVIDTQTIDHEMVIGSIKTNMIVPGTMVIGMGDHEAIRLRDTIIETTIVMKTVTLHVNNGKATKIEAKESSQKQF